MKVLITGASSGIGRAIAIEFSKFGYDLVLVARNLENLEKVKNEIGDKCKVEIYPMDLMNMENCISLHEQVQDIDILVNNAGFGLCGEFDSISLEKEMEMIDVNVGTLHTLMKLYLQDMIERDHGQILNVASIAGFMSGPLMATYYATKNYVVSLSEAVREELRHKKSLVKISILCPGPVETNFDKVAGVDFSLKAMSSERVAKYAVSQLKNGKFYITPGKHISFLRVASRLVPRSLLVKLVYFQQKKKRSV